MRTLVGRTKVWYIVIIDECFNETEIEASKERKKWMRDGRPGNRISEEKTEARRGEE
jgi:hypothetical protein